MKLNIPIFAMVDTNSDPRLVDFVIPANDDASKSIERVLTHVTDAIAEGLSSRKADKEKTKEAPKTAAAVASKEAPKRKEVKKLKQIAKEAPKAEEVKAATPTEETK